MCARQTPKGWILVVLFAVSYLAVIFLAFGENTTTENGDPSEETSKLSFRPQTFIKRPLFKGGGRSQAAQERLTASLQVTQNLGTLEERGLSKPLVLSYTNHYNRVEWPGMDLCPEQCDYTTDNKLFDKADLVLFQAWMRCDMVDTAPNGVQCMGWGNPFEIWDLPARNIRDQVWLFESRESQQNTASGQRLKFADGLFNYTVSFKHDSTIFFSYGDTKKVPRPNTDMYDPYTADKKSKLILWLVSHCNVTVRDDYVKRLSQYIPIDEFGACSGKHECGRHNYKCSKKMKMDYKFYVAFENTICDEYITEKLWETLISGMVPVVLGTNMEYYTRVTPPDSFLHVDNFTSPQALADYLLYLGNNDEAYNKYQEWRKTYQANTAWVKHSCDICRLAAEKPKSRIKLSEWWDMDTQCSNFTYSSGYLTPAILKNISLPIIDVSLTET